MRGKRGKVWKKKETPSQSLQSPQPLPPKYYRVYIYENFDTYVSAVDLGYTPYLDKTLIIDFDENETIESFKKKDDFRSREIERKMSDPDNLDFSYTYVIGLINLDTPEYNKMLAEEKIASNPLPYFSMISLVFSNDEISYATTNKKLAYEIGELLQTSDIRDVHLPYGPIVPIPDKRSLLAVQGLYEAKKYLSLYTNFLNYMNEFVKNPTGENYSEKMKSFYEELPDDFRHDFIDTVREFRNKAINSVLAFEKVSEGSRVSSCKRHPEIKEHTKGAYIAELSILTACYYDNIPVDGGLGVWLKTLGQVSVHKYIILVNDPKSNKLKVLLHMFDKISKGIYNYEYCSSRNNMISNLFFTGTCNCVCGSILMEALAEYIGVKNLFMVTLTGHIQNIFIDPKEIIALESTQASVNTNVLDTYKRSLPAGGSIHELLITPKVKVFGLLQITLKNTILSLKKSSRPIFDSAIVVWKEIFGDKYPEIEEYYNLIGTAIYESQDSYLDSYDKIMSSFPWNIDTLEDLLESIYTYLFAQNYFAIYTRTLIEGETFNLLAKLKELGSYLYRYYFIDRPDILRDKVSGGDYKYSVLSTVTSHEGKDLGELLPPGLVKKGLISIELI